MSVLVCTVVASGKLCRRCGERSLDGRMHQVSAKFYCGGCCPLRPQSRAPSEMFDFSKSRLELEKRLFTVAAGVQLSEKK